MKAALLVSKTNPIAFSIQEMPVPVPADDEMLIRVQSTSINAADYRSIQLGIKPRNGVFGADFAGVVEQCGNQVNQFKTGDKIFGDLSSANFGAFAEYVTARPAYTSLIPANLGFNEAAALPLAALTALNACKLAGGLGKGARVLVYGAGGGVGVYTVQIAKHLGAEVTALCGPGSVALLKSLGAENVLDYTKDEALGQAGQYDYIVAVNGNQPLTRYLRALAPRGKLIVVGGSYSQVIRTLLFRFFCSLGSKKISLLSFKPCQKDLHQIVELVEGNVLKPVIDQVFPLTEITQAFLYVKQGHVRGKVVIEVQE